MPPTTADEPQTFNAEELLVMIGAKQVLIERLNGIIARQSAAIAELAARLDAPAESAGEQTNDAD
jgi:hypothetical protein